jgi:hypothetical protein
MGRSGGGRGRAALLEDLGQRGTRPHTHIIARDGTCNCRGEIKDTLKLEEDDATQEWFWALRLPRA